MKFSILSQSTQIAPPELLFSISVAELPIIHFKSDILTRPMFLVISYRYFKHNIGTYMKMKLRNLRLRVIILLIVNYEDLVEDCWLVGIKLLENVLSKYRLNITLTSLLIVILLQYFVNQRRN